MWAAAPRDLLETRSPGAVGRQVPDVPSLESVRRGLEAADGERGGESQQADQADQRKRAGRARQRTRGIRVVVQAAGLVHAGGVGVRVGRAVHVDVHRTVGAAAGVDIHVHAGAGLGLIVEAGGAGGVHRAGGRAGGGAGHVAGRVATLRVIHALGGRAFDRPLLLDRLLVLIGERNRVARVGQVVIGLTGFLLLRGARGRGVDGALRVGDTGGQRQNHQDGKNDTLHDEFSSAILFFSVV